MRPASRKVYEEGNGDSDGDSIDDDDIDDAYGEVYTLTPLSA